MSEEKSEQFDWKRIGRSVTAYCTMYAICAVSAAFFGFIMNLVGISREFGWITGVAASIMFINSVLVTETAVVLDENMKIVNKNVQTVAVILSHMAKASMTQATNALNEALTKLPRDDKDVIH